VVRQAAFNDATAMQEAKMVSSDHFRQELSAQIDRAAKRGAEQVEINARELHRAVGGYPGPNHRMPSCCEVMQKEMKPGDVLVDASEQGKGAGLTIRYVLPRIG
jgi:5-methylcytosine-specific restriction protein A